MLKILRKKGFAKKILWFVAIVIIISFGFLGTAYLLTGQQAVTTAGSIFGRDVTFPTFEKAYRDVRIEALIRYGEQFNQYVATRDLDADTWDRLILLHEANRRRIRVNDDELVNIIRQYPFFQRDGQFDNLLYQDIVKYIFKVPARTFEEIIRDSLTISKLFSQETFTAAIEEEEIKDAFVQQNEKVRVSYVLVSPEQFINEASYEETKARDYYEANKVDFTIPQSINVDYIHIPYTDDSDPQSAEAEETTEAMAQAQLLGEKVLEEIRSGADFAEAAKNNGLEAKSSGFFSADKPNLGLGMSYELINNLFGLKKDEMIGPVETSNGYFIVRIADKQNAFVPDFEDAREAVKEALLKQAAMAIARQRSEEVLPALKAEYAKTLPMDFANAAKSLSLTIEQTPAFNRGQYLPKIGISRDFQESAFALSKENPISEPVETQIGYCIIHLDEYVPADDGEFALQKDRIAALLLNMKRIEIFQEFTHRLRQQAELIDNITKLKQQQDNS
jgi:peptidyl-prolyl cis-trans isomerase D